MVLCGHRGTGALPEQGVSLFLCIGGGRLASGPPGTSLEDYGAQLVQGFLVFFEMVHVYY